MYEILIYLIDEDYECEIDTLFSGNNLQMRIAQNLDEAMKFAAEELFDLVLVWPADFERTKTFLTTLNENGLSYLPVIPLIVNKNYLQELLSLEIADYILLPMPREEFMSVINGIITDLDVQATVMEGMNWQGSLEEYNLVDLFQMINDSQNDAELTLSCEGKNAFVYFKKGKIAHAELMNFRGEFALHKLVFWSSGNFQIKYSRHFSVDNSVQSSNQEVLLILAHDLSEWDWIYRELPDLFEELLTNPYAESSNISSLRNTILRKCKAPISIFSLLLEIEEENKTIIQEVKRLLKTNLIGKKREIESLIIQQKQQSGLTKFINAFSSVFRKNQEIKEAKEMDPDLHVEDSISRIDFEPFRLKEKEKESIIRKIESLN